MISYVLPAIVAVVFSYSIVASHVGNLSICKRNRCNEPLKLDEGNFVKVIEHVSEQHLHEFIDRVSEFEKSRFDVLPKSERYTSCCVTTHALTYVFLGKDIAKIIGEYFYNQLLVPINREVGNPRATTVRVRLLLDGLVYHRIFESNFFEFHTLSSEEQLSRLQEHAGYVIGSFCLFSDAAMTVFPWNRQLRFCGVSQQDCYVLQNIYKFNYPVVIALQSTIDRNALEVNENLAFVYLVFLLKKDSTEHTFVLTQFHDVDMGRVSYRLYQSWINELTLAENVADLRFKWSREDLQAFLNNLVMLICRVENSSKQTYQNCFGIGVTSSDLVVMENDEIHGLALRFFPFAIDPNICVHNLEEIFSSNEYVHSDHESLNFR